MQVKQGEERKKKEEIYKSGTSKLVLPNSCNRSEFERESLRELSTNNLQASYIFIVLNSL